MRAGFVGRMGPLARRRFDIIAKNGTALSSFITFTRAGKAWAFNKDGVLVEYAENEPRPAYIYDAVSNSWVWAGWHFEGARTNLTLNSSSPGSSGWNVGTHATMTVNQRLAPDGTNRMAKVVFSEDVAGAIARNSFATTASSVYATSIFLAADEPCTVQIRMTAQNGDNIIGAQVEVNLTTQTQRFFVPAGAVPGTTTWVAVRATASSVGKNIYVWGSQGELGSFSSSYIPTEGSAVTRAADVPIINNLAAIGFNSTTFGLVAEYYSPVQNNTAFGRIVQFDDNTAGNRIALRFSSTGDNVDLDIQGGAASMSQGPTMTYPATVRAALRYAVNDTAIAANGGSVSKDTDVSAPTVTRLRFGCEPNGSSASFFYLRELYYVPYGPTDTELTNMSKIGG